jgi:hypothetical protein
MEYTYIYIYIYIYMYMCVYITILYKCVYVIILYNNFCVGNMNTSLTSARPQQTFDLFVQIFNVGNLSECLMGPRSHQTFVHISDVENMNKCLMEPRSHQTIVYISSVEKFYGVRWVGTERSGG